MASFYCSTVQELLNVSVGQVLASLATAYALRGYTTQYSDQTLAWERDICSLRETLEVCTAVADRAASWGLVLEFSIPRKELRIDAVLLVGNTIVLLEAKTGTAGSNGQRQIEEYALLLHYFHKASDRCRIVPVLVSSTSSTTDRFDIVDLNQRGLFPQLSAYWIAPVARISWNNLSSLLLEVDRHSGLQVLATAWEASPYFPASSILEASGGPRTEFFLPCRIPVGALVPGPRDRCSLKLPLRGVRDRV